MENKSGEKLNDKLGDNKLPLSNHEVLKVLQAREKHSQISTEFKEYLEKVVTPSEYNINQLRKQYDSIEACMIINTNQKKINFKE